MSKSFEQETYAKKTMTWQSAMEEVFSEMFSWLSTYQREHTRKDHSKDLIESTQIIQKLLDQVEANSRQSVSILLDTANRLQVLEQLLLGWDSVE